jgi:hypothetical protein
MEASPRLLTTLFGEETLVSISKDSASVETRAIVF